MRPDELTETLGRRLRITLPEGIPGAPMLKGVHLTLLIGPLVPMPAPQSVLDALDERPGHRRGDGRERLPAHVRGEQELAAADDVPARRAASDPDGHAS